MRILLTSIVLAGMSAIPALAQISSSSSTSVGGGSTSSVSVGSSTGSSASSSTSSSASSGSRRSECTVVTSRNGHATATAGGLSTSVTAGNGRVSGTTTGPHGVTAFSGTNCTVHGR